MSKEMDMVYSLLKFIIGFKLGVMIVVFFVSCAFILKISFITRHFTKEFPDAGKDFKRALLERGNMIISTLVLNIILLYFMFIHFEQYKEVILGLFLIMLFFQFCCYKKIKSGEY